MDFETSRKKRMQVLEEKRKRVEEMRRRRGSMEAVEDKRDQTTPTASDAGDLDNLIASLLAEKDHEPKSGSSAQQTADVLVEAFDAPKVAAPAPEQKTVTLTVVPGIARVDVAPKVVEMYHKGEQTESPQTQQREEGDTPPVEERPPTHRRRNSRTYSVSHKGGLTLNQEDARPEHTRANSNPITPMPKEELQDVKPSLTTDQKKEIMQSPDFSAFLQHSSLIAERALGQVERFNIFVDYSTALDARDAARGDSDKITRSLKFQNDKLFEGRPVMDVEWSPHYGELFLGAYGPRSRRGGLQMGSSHADVDAEGMLAVWSVHLERPEYIFTAASSVLTAHFHKFDSHLVIGGTYSGQILLWDLRSKAMPVQWTSLAAGGHTHPVYSMEIIGSSGAHELVSASTDGKLCHWDMARLQEPRSVRDLSIDLSNVSTDTTADPRKPVYVSCFAFGQGESTRNLILGSESGKLYSTHVPPRQNDVMKEYEGHFGVATSLHFHQGSNRALKDLLLSSSVDWTVKLWNLNLSAKPLLTFQQPSYEYICDVKWSPIHPAVFGTINSAGELALWNLNHSLQEPVVPGFLVSDAPSSQHSALTRMVWSADGRRTLIGDVGGTIHILTVADELAKPRGDEEAKLERVLESENISLRAPVGDPPTYLQAPNSALESKS